MKKEWEIFKEFIGSVGIDPEKYMELRRKTALEALATRYRNFAVVSIFVAVYFVITSLYFGDDIELINTLMYFTSAVCCIGSVTDFILYYKIRSIDIYSMPVSEVIERAYQCRKIHVCFVAIMLPVAIGFIIWFCYRMSEDRFMLASLIIGGLIGLTIGLRFLYKFMSDYKAVIKED